MSGHPRATDFICRTGPTKSCKFVFTALNVLPLNNHHLKHPTPVLMAKTIATDKKLTFTRSDRSRAFSPRWAVSLGGTLFSIDMRTSGADVSPLLFFNRLHGLQSMTARLVKEVFNRVKLFYTLLYFLCNNLALPTFNGFVVDDLDHNQAIVLLFGCNHNPKPINS